MRRFVLLLVLVVAADAFFESAIHQLAVAPRSWNSPTSSGEQNRLVVRSAFKRSNSNARRIADSLNMYRVGRMTHPVVVDPAGDRQLDLMAL